MQLKTRVHVGKKYATRRALVLSGRSSTLSMKKHVELELQHTGNFEKHNLGVLWEHLEMV